METFPIDWNMVDCPPESVGLRPDLQKWSNHWMTTNIHCPFYGAEIELFGDSNRNYVDCVYKDCVSPLHQKPTSKS